jgi:hypothetical protein
VPPQIGPQKIVQLIAMPHALATSQTYQFTVLTDLGNIYAMTVTYGDPIAVEFAPVFVPTPPTR